MEFLDLTEKIIGCTYRIHNTLGFGFLESVYEKCLEIEFNKEGLSAEFQKPVEVFYENKPVGSYVVDVLVEGQIIVELKAVRTLNTAHEVQLVNYLTATKIPLGLLINFGEKKVEVKRKFLKFDRMKV